MQRLKPNKFPSKCAVCGVSFERYTGTLFFERTSTITQGRGRPEGKFVAFCKDHQKEANERLMGIKEDTQETPRNDPWQDDPQEIEEAISEALAPPTTQETPTEKEIETPKKVEDKEGVALDIAQLLTKLTSNPGVDKGEVNKLIHEYVVNERFEERIKEVEANVKSLNWAPPTQIQIIKRDDAQTLDIGLHHYILSDVITTLSQGLHVYLVGPAGSGKTTMASQAAKALGKKFYFTGAINSEYKLLSFRDGNGNYHRTPFREAFEHGGVFLFDEIDASSANALMAFNAALANGHMDFPDGIVERHPDFICIAAANTYGNGADRIYIGRNQLDGSTLDRFPVIEMGYDEKLERALVGTDPKAVAWVEFVQRTRKAVDTLKLRYVVSPRASLQGSKLLLAGMDTDKVAKMVLYRSMKAEDIAKVQQYAPIPR